MVVVCGWVAKALGVVPSAVQGSPSRLVSVEEFTPV
jgi:hypothetical protein